MNQQKRERLIALLEKGLRALEISTVIEKGDPELKIKTDKAWRAMDYLIKELKQIS